MAHRLLPPLLALVVAGCAKPPANQSPGATSDPNAPPPRVCTMMGCTDGLRVMTKKATPWPPGAYEFAFDLDGTKVSCTGSLPLPSCEQSPSLKCDVPDRVQIGESGCALPPEQHGYADIGFTGEPVQVKISVRHAGKEIAAQELTPSYKVVQPNGEGCEPTCNSATAELEIP